MTDTSEHRGPAGSRAVAIKKEDEAAAPHITAKGKGYLAERILEIAFASGVKVREDRELAQLLETFDVDCPVPLEALDAVSEILRYVYAADRRLGGDKLATQISLQSGPTGANEHGDR